MNALKKMMNGDLYRVLDTSSEDYKRGRLNEVGDLIMFEDGRCFRFVSSAVDVDAGEVVKAQASSAELAAKLDAATANSRTVTVELASVTANKYQGGYLTITAGAVETTYVINKNTASDASDKVVLTLKDPLQEAVTATDDCILRPNRHSLVTLGGAATDDVVGVAVSNSTAGTDSRTAYFWVQVKGPGSVKVTTGATLTKGLGFIAGGSAGVVVAAAVTNRILGYNLAEAAVSDGDITQALLCIE